MSRLRDVA